MRTLKTIYEILKEFKKEDIDKVIDTLSLDDKRIIEKCYSNERNWSKEESYYYYHLLIPRLKNMIKKNQRKIKTIYDYFTEYSKDEVDEAIEHLNDYYKHVLYLRFGEDYLNPVVSSEWSTKYSQIFHHKILMEMERYLKYKITTRKIKTIYELIPGYSKEQINEAISKLNEEEKKLIYLKYGDNLERPHTSSEWNHTYTRKFFTNTVRKLKSILRKQEDTIYNYFPSYSQEQIDYAITLLNSVEKAELVLCFNYELNNVSLNNIVLTKRTKSSLLGKIDKRLKKIYGGQNIKTIYDYFPSFSKEEIDNAIECLPNIDKELLYFKYNGSLDTPIKNLEWNSKYSSRFQYVIRKVSGILNGGKTYCVTIYDYFKDISKEKINGILIGLPYKEKEIIYLKYGENLNDPIMSEMWRKELSKLFFGIINKIKTKIKKLDQVEEVMCFEKDLEYQKIIMKYKALKYEKKEINDINKNLNFGLDVQQKLMNVLNTLEYQVVSLKYIENISIKDISSILGVEEQIIINILKKAMYLYKAERLKQLEKSSNDELTAKVSR